MVVDGSTSAMDIGGGRFMVKCCHGMMVCPTMRLVMAIIEGLGLFGTRP